MLWSIRTFGQILGKLSRHAKPDPILSQKSFCTFLFNHNTLFLTVVTHFFETQEFIDVRLFGKFQNTFALYCLVWTFNVLNYILFSQMLDHYLHKREKKVTWRWFDKRTWERAMHHLPPWVWTNTHLCRSVIPNTCIRGNQLRNINPTHTFHLKPVSTYDL